MDEVMNLRRIFNAMKAPLLMGCAVVLVFGLGALGNLLFPGFGVVLGVALGFVIIFTVINLFF